MQTWTSVRHKAKIIMAVAAATIVVVPTSGAFAADSADTVQAASPVATPLADTFADAGDSNSVLEQVDAAAAIEHAAPTTDNPAVQLPDRASDGAELGLDDGQTLTMSLPARGDATTADNSTLLDGTAPDTGLVVQSTAAGLRALITIDSPSAPERFAFRVGGDVASLSARPDGSVLALDASGDVIADLATPWARDADGRDVPTHFEIDGTTVVQVVEHRGGSFAYGITADPFWSSVWKYTKCAAAVAALAFVGSKIYRAIKSLGGVTSAVRLMLGAGNIHDFIAAAGNAGVAILGISTIRKECF